MMAYCVLTHLTGVKTATSSHPKPRTITHRELGSPGAGQLQSHHTANDEQYPDDLRDGERFVEGVHTDDADRGGARARPDRVGDADLQMLDRKGEVVLSCNLKAVGVLP